MPSAAMGFFLAALCAPFSGASAPGVPPHARAGPSDVVVSSLPTALSDSAFWRLSTDLSEPDGDFPYDNFVSNESAFEDALPQLQRTTRPGGVFIGVGPEQNFTYIAALHPGIAFIVDIRREALLQHLMYKAVFELSPDRAEFVSRLFSRPRQAQLAASAAPEVIMNAYAAVPADVRLFNRNLAAVESLLTKAHGFAIDGNDLSTIIFLYNSFFRYGPEITYEGTGGPFATFAQMVGVADSGGVHRGFLANEANYRAVREMQQHNLIIPVVGDFAGPKALRAIGAYLKAHNAIVSAFYTSNVEQWLFTPDNTWKQFYANVATLPMDSTSVFIRATPSPQIALSTDASYGREHPLGPSPSPDTFRAALVRLGIPSRPAMPCTTPPAPRVVIDTTRHADGTFEVIRKPGFRVGASAGYGDLAICLASMADVVKAFNAGLIDRYSQVVALSQ